MTRESERLSAYVFCVKTEIEDWAPFYNGEPDQGLITEVTCSIRFPKGGADDESDDLIEIGRLNGVLADIGQAREHGVDAHDACDCRDSLLENAYSTLFDAAGNMRNEDDEYVDRMLLIEDMEIETIHRGSGLGLALVWRLCTMFSSAYVLADLADKPRLSAYFARLGFKKRDDFMVFNTALKVADLDTALRGLRAA